MRLLFRDASARPFANVAMRSLPDRIAAHAFARGILICPEGRSEEHLALTSDGRLPRTITSIGDAGLFFLSSDPGLRRFHTWLNIFHAEEPHPDPRQRWDTTWTLTTPEALAAFDLTGRNYGRVTDVAGTYLVRSRMVDACESPGDDYYVPPGLVLEVTMLDPTSGQPTGNRWWDFLDP